MPSASPTQLDAVEQVRSKLIQVAAELRSFCSSVNFQGDRLSCANSADVADAFRQKAEAAGGLYARAMEGDGDAARRFIESGSKLVLSLTGTPFALKDSTLTDLGNRIATDVKNNAGKIGAGLGFGIGTALVVGGGGWLLFKVFAGRKGKS